MHCGIPFTRAFDGTPGPHAVARIASGDRHVTYWATGQGSYRIAVGSVNVTETAPADGLSQTTLSMEDISAGVVWLAGLNVQPVPPEFMDDAPFSGSVGLTVHCTQEVKVTKLGGSRELALANSWNSQGALGLSHPAGTAGAAQTLSTSTSTNETLVFVRGAFPYGASRVHVEGPGVDETWVIDPRQPYREIWSTGGDFVVEVDHAGVRYPDYLVAIVGLDQVPTLADLELRYSQATDS